ncbi:hypothetical protein NDU88_006192 [Pleurodeles waltl]|uniref:Uncharacterized protein n=1 Tax=Pleurodeles waltl TaxID=8319 RepID=A0AAV7LPZ3_PLEWA|nr:hypothetical protein NDU88_006192 [Pleurodeles waltl]
MVLEMVREECDVMFDYNDEAVSLEEGEIVAEEGSARVVAGGLRRGGLRIVAVALVFYRSRQCDGRTISGSSTELAGPARTHGHN